MKWKKIILWVILFLAVSGISIIYVTRNQWIQYYLKKEISTVTRGKVKLNFDRVKLDVFKRKLTVFRPSLTFKGIYLDKKHGLVLRRSDFNQLQVHNLSLWKLLSNGEYFINNLTINNPLFYLGTQDTLIYIDKKRVIEPIEIIRILQTKTLSRLPFYFHINKLEVKDGLIKLISNTDSTSYGTAQYDISIQNLESVMHNDSVGFKPLQYEQLKINIKDLNRYSKKNNYRFRIDSLKYTSEGHILTLNGFEFEPFTSSVKNYNIAKIKLNQIVLSGMKTDTIKDKYFLHFHNLEVSDGTIQLRYPVAHSKSGQDDKVITDNFFKHYKAVKLDQFSVHDVKCTVQNDKDDTLFNAQNTSFIVSDIHLSGKGDKKIFNYFEYGNLKLHFNNSLLNDPISGNILKVKSIDYSSTEKKLQLSSFDWRNSCYGAKKYALKLSGPSLFIKNFKLKTYLKNEVQKVIIVSENPEIHISNNGKCTGILKSGRKNKLLLIPQTLILHNGLVSFINKNTEKLDISGLDGYLNNFYQIISNPKHFKTDTLNLSVKSLRFSNQNNKTTLKINNVKLSNHLLISGELKFNHQEKNNFTSAEMKKIMVKQLNLEQLLSNKVFDAYHLIIKCPRFTFSGGFKPIHLNNLSVQKQYLQAFYLNKLTISDGNIEISDSSHPEKFQFNSAFTLNLDDFLWRNDSGITIKNLKNIELGLSDFKLQYENSVGNFDALHFSQKKKTIQVSQLKIDNILQGLNLRIPKLKLTGLPLVPLFTDNELHFSNIILSEPIISAKLNKQEPELREILKHWNITFDSLQVNKANFQLYKQNKRGVLSFGGTDLNLDYIPQKDKLNSAIPDTLKNLIHDWQFSLQKLILSDTISKFHAVADQIELQSKQDKVSIESLSGGNIPKEFNTDKKFYADFKLKNIQWKGLFVSDDGKMNLHIKKWIVPSIWVHLVNNNKNSKPKSLDNIAPIDVSAINNLFNSIKIDTTFLNNVDVVYSYDKLSKQIIFPNGHINIGDIRIDSSLNSEGDLFQRMVIDTQGKSIISGDSLYVFRTKDIRINLPQKRITLDSITLLPRYSRKQFFEIEKIQTDRISVYGKSIDIVNFDLPSLLNYNLLRAENLKFDNFNILLERDKRFPADTTEKPMPLDLLQKIPYRFKLDSIQLNHSQVSYYEYEKKSLLPGIFFIDNFNVNFLDVSNNLSHLDSSAVLKINGNGNLMRETPLNFVLAIPYFAADNQFWFSAQTQWADLREFNSLMQNNVGISIKKGTARSDVQYLSGNDKIAKGNMLFEYKNLKLRLFNRKKAVLNKSLGSPFVNFMLNNLMIRSSNPKFLKPPRQGFIYYERDPQKSFINYIWKSSLSGILSTLGFNNKQQRQEKRSVKQSAGKTKKHRTRKNDH